MMDAPVALVRTLAVWFPDWPLAVYREAAGRAGVVAERHVVVAATEQARAEGVRPGQRVREAERRVPGLMVWGRDRVAEFHAFQPVVHALASMAPELSVGDPGWITVPVRGPARYYGGEEAFVETVGVALGELLRREERAVSWRTGLAEGVFAAMLAARRGLFVPPGRTPEFLARLPIAVLDDHSLADLLDRLGITTLGAFCALAPEDVLGRFGMPGFRAYQQAGGRESFVMAPPAVGDGIIVTRCFDEPVLATAAVATAAAELADELVARAAAQGTVCTICEVGFAYEDGTGTSRRWQRTDGWEAAALTERVRWQLEVPSTSASGSEPDTPVGMLALSLRAAERIDAGGSQLGLWERPRERDEEVARVCARLEGMLGEGSVVQAELAGGRGPLERVVFRAFGEPARATGAGMPWPGRLPPPNPVVVYADRPSVELVDRDGRDVRVDRRGVLGGDPAAVSLPNGEVVAVVEWTGAWPSDERWWDRRRASRRARLQLVLADGRALLVASAHARWQLEGSYD